MQGHIENLVKQVRKVNDAAQTPVPDMQASPVVNGVADLIQEESDKAMSTFSSKRTLQTPALTTQEQGNWFDMPVS
jgi:hypothetical protein